MTDRACNEEPEPSLTEGQRRAIEFVVSVGGIDNARQLLAELDSLQIDSEQS